MLDGSVKLVGPLSIPGEWTRELQVSADLVAVQIGNGRYVPIPPLVKLTPHRVLMIGCRNPLAKPSWFLGCWLSVELLCSPSSTSQLAGLAELQHHAIPLQRYKLIVIPEIETESPYRLRFRIPYWHQEIRIEAFYLDNTLTTDIQASLERLEAAVNTL
ncbi:MAG: hypothetical protein KME35_08085 [Aphanocapsa sp. GSE-SYN-MK-11-07L]|jgi:hypothetical protein|nr:hypothetical protein [Aphanocapsa sp. GSE-SYN-MK-11-07L]